MNNVELRTLQNQIQSLTDSTYLQVEYRNIQMTLDGRCSPLISHQGTLFDVAFDNHFGSVVVRNTRYTIYLDSISHEGYSPGGELPVVQNGWECKEVDVLIPGGLFRGLAEELALVGYELPRLLDVLFFLPILDGWKENEEGRIIPILRPAKEVTCAE